MDVFQTEERLNDNTKSAVTCHLCITPPPQKKEREKERKEEEKKVQRPP